ncbi:MAG TPA: hypothetical protein VFE04_04605, partial [Puia sp.]|nr:hypothetical protein [Puia sp.]
MTKKRRSRKSKFELHFTMVNCLVLMVVFTATLGLYYHSLTDIYSAQLNRSNDSLVQQVGNSFEIVYTQIKDYLYQIPVYDQELAKFAQEYDGSAISKNHLIKKMDSITYGNHFLYSCYMYLDKHDEVFDSENGQFTSMDTFFDKSIFDKTSNQQIVVLPPHNIVNRSTKSLVSVISVLSPLPIFSSNSAGVIVFNINVDKLYTNIMKQLPVDNNMNMSIFSLDGNPIINGELVRQHFMGNATADQPKESDVIGNASYTSPSLKWVFQLQNKMSSQEITRTKFYSSLLAIIPAMAAAIFIVLLIIERLTKNVGRVLRDHDKNQLKVFLLNEGSKKVGFGQALQGFTQPFYHVITVQEI